MLKGITHGMEQETPSNDTEIRCVTQAYRMVSTAGTPVLAKILPSLEC